MFFENFDKDLPDIPRFETFYLRDRNPVARTNKRRFCAKQNMAMKMIHRRFSDYLRKLGIATPFSVGSIPSGSPKNNVARHRLNRFFYVLDIKNAYSSVNGKRLSEIICQIDSSLGEQEEKVLAFLKQYCLTGFGGLITGATASPDLFNLYAGVLIDFPMADLCKRYNLTCTRYLDDLTFSSPVPIGKKKRIAVRKIIRQAGFAINHRKTGVYDLKKGPIFITGVGLEFGGRIFLPRHYLRKINGVMYMAAKNGDETLKNKLNGMMGVFWGAVNRRDLNKTELKILEIYRALRKIKQ